MTTVRSRTLAIAGVLLLHAVRAEAQDSTRAVRPDSARQLGSVRVVAEREARVTPAQAATLRATASITATRAHETVNLVDTEDAVKYLPSLFLRKRNNGDTQAVMGTRVWGVSSSARSLVFADGVPLSALIANNNTIGGPRWGLVAPNEIQRIDVMYGPFSAAYAGNSMGAVMEITTRMPDRLEGSLSQTGTSQAFSLYGTDRRFRTSQTSGSIGNRFGRFSFRLSGNYQDSHAQPLTYVTAGAFPTGTTGGFGAFNKLGAAANVLGATGLLHTGMTNAKARLGWDVSPTLRAAYTFGFWENDASSRTESFLQRSGSATYAGLAGFATGHYELLQRHTSHNVSLRTNNPTGNWDWEVVGTTYRFDKDQQRSPTTALATGLGFGTAGRVAVLDGTNWRTLDARAVWHRGGAGAAHVVSMGMHQDRYELANPTFNTAEWKGGAFTTVANEGDGKTRTRALWLQDAWRLAPEWRLTLGARYEDWRAWDGLNVNGGTRVVQRAVNATHFSPKAVLAWEPTPDLTITASTGKAYRFATAAELYQLVTTGTTFTSPNPNLKPDNVLATELRVDRRLSHGRMQLALFQDNVRDAMIAQFLPLVPNSPTLYSYVSNVDKVRARGAELVLGARTGGRRPLELNASATWLDARTLALDGRANATAGPGTAVGKFLPNIPKWRLTTLSTWRPAESLSLSLAGRYSGKLWTTLDNADVNPNTYQGFSGWFVADARAKVRVRPHWSLSLGVDNLLDRKYFLFHPFPQRTLVGTLGYEL